MLPASLVLNYMSNNFLFIGFPSAARRLQPDSLVYSPRQLQAFSVSQQEHRSQCTHPNDNVADSQTVQTAEGVEGEGDNQGRNGNTVYFRTSVQDLAFRLHGRKVIDAKDPNRSQRSSVERATCCYSYSNMA